MDHHEKREASRKTIEYWHAAGSLIQRTEKIATRQWYESVYPVSQCFLFYSYTVQKTGIPARFAICEPFYIRFDTLFEQQALLYGGQNYHLFIFSFVPRRSRSCSSRSEWRFGAFHYGHCPDAGISI